jgi:hypothetical protein
MDNKMRWWLKILIYLFLFIYYLLVDAQHVCNGVHAGLQSAAIEDITTEIGFVIN